MLERQPRQFDFVIAEEKMRKSQDRSRTGNRVDIARKRAGKFGFMAERFAFDDGEPGIVANSGSVASGLATSTLLGPSV
jgi:hypothetical protein